jgi:hypothetical protein
MTRPGRAFLVVVLLSVLTALTTPLAAEAQRVVRVSLFGAIEDTQTRSHRGMFR